MSVGIAIAVACGTFLLGLILAPRKVDCEHQEYPVLPLINSPSFKEMSLERENMVLRGENNQLRWQYEKLRAYGGRECCEHCHLLCKESKEKEELNKIMKKMTEAHLSAKDLADKLSV